MRMLSLAGLYWKDAAAGSVNSGIYYNTQPTDIPLNAQMVEADKDGGAERVFQFVRISGTCTVGDLLYQTGTNGAYVCKSGTGGVRPIGVSMVAPTASGSWSWIQKYGKNTSIQITSTFSVAYPSVGMFTNGGSAAINQSDVISAALIGSGGVGVYSYIGQALTVATGSQAVGFINLL